MPELCPCGNWNRLPVGMGDFPSGHPPLSPFSSSPEPEMKLEDPEATDEPLDTVMPDRYIPAGVLAKSTTRYPGSEIALLEKHEWICTRSLGDSNNVQVFVLPQQKSISRPKKGGESETAIESALKLVMSMIDSSPGAWNGSVDAHAGLLANTQPDTEEESLYYIYNTLQDPEPNLDQVIDPFSQVAMEELLDDSVRGLKTTLYPYQRKSAAAMVQREAHPALTLDPRFQPWQGPTGLEFYYDKVNGSILREKIYYPEACGGILAESMGCGKTLISLAVILATRGHSPKIPVEYQTLSNPIREKTGTLMQMAAAAANRFVPWKDRFDRMQDNGEDYSNCRNACVAQSCSYIIPAPTQYGGRSKSEYNRSAKEIRLCSGTLIIVPDNLVDHWEHEIATHTNHLKVLALQHKSVTTPSMDELLDFDIVLFSKSRFKKRGKFGQNPNSSVFDLHWLRVIVDEGHDVAGRTTDMVHLLKEELHCDRRWIISGTPLSELYGVELSIASQEVDTDDTESSPDGHTDATLQKDKKAGKNISHEIKDLDKLGLMVHHFFKLKPWSNDRGDWPLYTRRVDEDGMCRKSPSLRATLQSLVVRHRYETVKKEITLPPLYNKVVYLEPTFYDRLYINIFLFTLAVNVITSERQGPDYMFDENKKNKSKLTELIQNLRLAGFWWAGSDDVQSTIDIALEYLEGNQEKMTVADFNQLKHGIQIGRKAISSPGWNGFKKMHELGVFVRDFPEHARNMWALDSADADYEPLLMGMTQARRAQQFVTSHLRAPDPAEGLAGEGIKVRWDLIKHSQTGTPAHSGAPESSNSPASKSSSKRKRKNPEQTFKKKLFHTVPETSPLRQTKLEGVASAKLRYLLEQVLKFQKTEKIIIFYEHGNVASWVEQGLDLIAVNFRTYASTMSMGSNLKTEYLFQFRQTEEVRVLLMSVKEASHGLHIPEASRMYIVNPIWERNVESQAIKRAHRIGQKRPVYVETLVLGDTLEHRMLNRSKNMTAEETKRAGSNPLDDNTMSKIIQNEPFLSMLDEASSGMAPLTHPIGLFDQHKLPIPDNEVPARGPLRQRGQQKKRQQRGPDSDANSDSAGVQGPPAQRRRIGFANQDQVMGESAVDALPGPQQPVPRSNSGFGAGVPVSGPSQTGFADDVVVIIDGGEESGPLHSVPIHSVSDSTGGGIDRRASLFGPFS
ncbi:SNF2-related protein [Penicillium cf. griseofulvum]|nr:SNF2-related protein [Penicillium cf. griseofulvum]